MIVNPYATSLRAASHLVVAALQGRFEVDAVTPRRRATRRSSAARPRTRAMTWSSPSAATARSTKRRTASRARPPRFALPAGRLGERVRQDARHPRRTRGRDRHLLAMADDWHPRSIDLGVVNGRCFTFASGLGLDASVVERVDANPRLKARLGPYFFAAVAVSTFLRRYLRLARRGWARGRRRNARGRDRDHPERLARSPTSRTARSISRTPRSTRARSRAGCCTARAAGAARDRVARVSPRARVADRQVTGLSRARPS